MSKKRTLREVHMRSTILLVLIFGVGCADIQERLTARPLPAENTNSLEMSYEFLNNEDGLWVTYAFLKEHPIKKRNKVFTADDFINHAGSKHIHFDPNALIKVELKDSHGNPIEAKLELTVAASNRTILFSTDKSGEALVNALNSVPAETFIAELGQQDYGSLRIVGNDNAQSWDIKQTDRAIALNRYSEPMARYLSAKNKIEKQKILPDLVKTCPFQYVGECSSWGKEYSQLTDKMSFHSFGEAQQVLGPLITDDGTRGAALMMNPMSLQGRIFTARFTVLQALSSQTLLLTIPGAMEVGMPDAYYYGAISKSFRGPKGFIDGQIVYVIGKIIGTQQYTTAMDTIKTVPKIHIYGIAAGS